MLWWMVQNAVVAAVLAAVVLLICRLWRCGPAVRHALWLVVLVKLMSPPLVHWPWRLPAAPGYIPSAAANPVERRVVVPPLPKTPGAASLKQELPPPGKTASAWKDNKETWTLRPTPEPFPETKPIPAFSGVGDAPAPNPLTPSPGLVDPPPQPVARQSRSDRPAPAAVTPNPTAALRRWLRPAPLLLLALWLAGAAAMAVLQTVRIVRLRRRLTGAGAAPTGLVARLEELSAQLGVRLPQTLVLAGGGQPFLWCFGRPTLVLPAAFSESFDAACGCGVVAHELAHLRRRDHWVSWLNLAGACVWWWFPLYWCIQRKLAENAELACDAWVVWALPGSRRAYADSLIDAWHSGDRAVPLAPAFAMGRVARRSFERRLTMVMRGDVPRRISRRGLVAVALLAAVVLPGWSGPAEPPLVANKKEAAAEPMSLKEARHEISSRRKGYEYVDLAGDPFQKPASVTFKDAELEDAIHQLAGQAGLDVVMRPDDVRGRLTLEIENAPIGAVLASVLRTNKLELIREEGGIYRVVPSGPTSGGGRLVEEITVHIPINWVPAADVKKALDPIVDGDVTADPKGNSIIITDTPLKIEEIAEIIRKLDTPARKRSKRVNLTEERFQKTISVSFKDAPLEEVIIQLARQAGLDVVVRPGDVTGRLTVQMQHVPVGAALASVLRTNNLALEQEAGGIYRIVPSRTIPGGEPTVTVGSAILTDTPKIEGEIADVIRNWDKPKPEEPTPGQDGVTTGSRRARSKGRDRQFVNPIEERFHKIISFTFKDAEVKNALRILFREADLKVAMDSEIVTGTITVELNNVPVGAALATVLRINRLDLIRESNGVYRVVPVRGRRVEEITGHVPLEHIPAAETEKVLDPLIDGDLTVDRKNNAIILTDTPKIEGDIADVIRRLDAPDSPNALEKHTVKRIRLDLSSGKIDERQFVVPYGGVTVVDGKLRFESGNVLRTVEEFDPAIRPVEISMHAELSHDNAGIVVNTRSSGDNRGEFQLPTHGTVAGALGPHHEPWGCLRFGWLENGRHSPIHFIQGDTGREFDLKVRDDGRLISMWVNGVKRYEFECTKRFDRNFVSITTATGQDGPTFVSNLVIRTYEKPAKNEKHPQRPREINEILAFDDFEDVLSLEWEILHPDPSHYTLDKKRGALTITTQEGTFSYAYSNYENLFLIDCPAENARDFQVTTCISDFKPVERWNVAGLVLFNDEDDWLAGTYRLDLAGKRVFGFGYDVVAGGPNPTRLYAAEQDIERVWLRLTKKGNHYLFSTSLDGKSFRIHDEMAWGDGRVAKLGLLADNGVPSQAPELDASFEFFMVESVPAGPPDETTSSVEAITVHIPLNWVSASVVKTVLDPLVEREVVADLQGNSIILTDSPLEVEEIAKLILHIDNAARPARGIAPIREVGRRDQPPGMTRSIDRAILDFRNGVAGVQKKIESLDEELAREEARVDQFRRDEGRKELADEAATRLKALRREREEYGEVLRSLRGYLQLGNDRGPAAGTRTKVLARDDFEDVLSLEWDILHPDPSHYSLDKNPGYLTVTTQAGAFYESWSDYKNLFLIDCPAAAAGNFQITTHLSSFRPQAPWNAAGVICYNDDDNYLLGAYGWNLAGADRPVFAVGREAERRNETTFFEADLELDEVWLRLTRNETTFGFSTSLDGKMFRHHGDFAWGDGSVKKVGLYAKNGGGSTAPELDAMFDSFEVASIPAKPEKPALKKRVGDDVRVLAFDDFEDVLSLEWDILRPDKSHYSLEKKRGALTIATQEGSLAPSRADCKNVFLIDCPTTGGEDFQMTTCIASFAPVAVNQAAGLVCYNDAGYLLHGVYSWYPPGQRMFHLGHETKGRGVPAYFSAPQNAERLWLRLTKIGNRYVLAASLDGETFHIRGETQWGDGLVKKVGFYAANGSPSAAPELDAAFEFFEVTTVPRGPQPIRIERDQPGLPVRAFDDFDGRLGLRWQILHADPTHFSLARKPGNLTIRTQTGDLCEQYADYENIFLIDCPTAPGADFIMTTCLSSFEPFAMHHGVSAICYNDDDNYILGGYCWGYGRRQFAVREETNTRAKGEQFEAEQDIKRLWLRIAKRGDRYAFSTSLDGKTFRVHDERPWGDGTVKKLGITASHGGGCWPPEVDASFDFFEVRALPPDVNPARPKARAHNDAGLLAFDDFEDVLSLEWDILRPDPTHYSLTKSPGNLTIRTQTGDMCGPCSDYENVFVVDCPTAPDADFQVTTCLSSFEPKAMHNSVALICFNDEDNYLTGGYCWGFGRRQFGDRAETQGQPVGDMYDAEQDIKRLWLRIAKHGNRYAFSTSLDGKTFRVHGERAWGDGTVRKLGILAQDGSGCWPPEVDASFDFFEVRGAPPGGGG